MSSVKTYSYKVPLDGKKTEEVTFTDDDFDESDNLVVHLKCGLVRLYKDRRFELLTKSGKGPLDDLVGLIDHSEKHLTS